MKIDEQSHRAALHPFRGAIADGAAELVDSSQGLRRGHQLFGPSEARLAGAEQRFVRDQALLRPAHDRLEGELETGEGAREAHREAAVLRLVLAVEIRLRFALGLRQLLHAHGALDDFHQLLGVDRLQQIAEGAELDGLHGRREMGRACDEDDGQLEAALTHCAEQLHAVDSRQGQVGDERVEGTVFEQRKGDPAVSGQLDGEARGTQYVGEDPAQRRIVVDHQHAAVVAWTTLHSFSRRAPCGARCFRRKRRADARLLPLPKLSGTDECLEGQPRNVNGT